MTKYLTLLFLLIGFIGTAQKLTFEYDSAGNQTQRKYCPICPGKTSSETPKEISELKQEDLQHFFPGDVISYYPNPVKEQLYIKWELLNNVRVSEIQFYSLSGQLIKTISKLENTDNQVIDFRNLPSTLYTVLLKYSNGEEKSIKIVKE